MARVTSTGNYLKKAAPGDLTGAGTIFIRFKPNGWSSGVGSPRTLFGYSDSAANTFLWYLGNGGDNNIYVGWVVSGSSTRIVIADTGIFSDGVWANHLFDWDEDSDLQHLYVDNTLKGTSSSAFAIGTGLTDVCIGTNSPKVDAGIDAHSGQGHIAEFARWDHVLDSTERSTLQATGNPACLSTGLVHHYKILGDDSPEPDEITADDLTVVGSPTQTTHPTLYPCSFTLPTDRADLSLWLRADSIVGLSDGDFVTAWVDESANARSFEQADTSKAPIWQDNDINGLPSVEFGAVASDDYLETASSFDALGGLFNSGGDAVTIFLVQCQAGSQANHGNIAWHTFGAHITYSDSIYFDAANNTTGRINVAQPGGWDDAFHIIELYRSGSSGEINVDNSNLLSSSFSASLGSVTTTMVLGRYASTYFKGKIAEVVFYKRALNSTERGDVYDYLYNKYFAAGGSNVDCSASIVGRAGVKAASSVLRSAPAKLTGRSTVRSAISRAVGAHAEIMARSNVTAKGSRIAGASAKLNARSTVKATSSVHRGASVRIHSRSSIQTRASAWRSIAAKLQARSGVLLGEIDVIDVAPGRIFKVHYEDRIFRVPAETRMFKVPRS